MNLKGEAVSVVGLGYVGLPLAVAFGRSRPVVGFDIDSERIAELERGVDRTLEVSAEELAGAVGLRYTSNLTDLADCRVHIITVPTPIDAACRPDFDPLLKASSSIGRILRKGDVVIFESTVYPGVTEEVCVPVIERESGLTYNVDFYCGYSPERINPGDKDRKVADIVKVTSGSTPEVAEAVDELYREIVRAGTHKASSIRVAEAAKVIENTQRDLNIALMNELARLFDRIGIDTQEVLAAARTKWNFLPFVPGLVGGHCIGVDPYYLTHKATMLGYNPELILAARRINDGMAEYVANRIMRLMAECQVNVVGARVLVMGVAFKENCPDIRNTKVVDVVRELQAVNARVDIHDPWVDADDLGREYGLSLVAEPATAAYDVVVLAVPHEDLVGPAAKRRVEDYVTPGGMVFDLKGRLERREGIYRL